MDKHFAIFDMDGTLIDSMGFWGDLASEYLHSKGIRQIPADILERIQPMTMSESAALFRAEFGLTGDPEAQMNAMMQKHYQQDIPLKSGVREYLQKFQGKGVRMCVASATAEHLMDACLTRLGVRNCFEFLLSCEAVGAGKHRPLIYQESARRFCAEPKDIAVFEDAPYAVRTAKNAGFYVVGVYDGSAAKSWKTIEELSDEIIFNWEEA